MSDLIRTAVGVGVAVVGTFIVFVGANKTLDRGRRQWGVFTGVIGALVGMVLIRLLGHGEFVPGSLWMLPVGAAVGGAVGFGIAQVTTPDDVARDRIVETIRPYTFVVPAYVFLAATLIVPAIRTLWLSLLGNDGGFIGLENYGWIATNDEIFTLNGLGNLFTSPLMVVSLLVLGAGLLLANREGRRVGIRFDFGDGPQIVLTAAGCMLALFALFATLRGVVWNNAWWVVAVTGLSTAAGLAIAVLADRARFENLAKSLIFLPMAISFVGAAVIWRFVYVARPAGRDQIGLLNAIWVGLGGEPQLFLEQQPWNTLFIIIVMIWIQTGFAMVVLSSAIKGVPEDLREAASVDGATESQIFWRITLPQIRPTVVVVVSTTMILVLKVFDLVKVMTGGQNGTNVIANEMFDQSFRNFNFGRGSALAMVLFIAVLPLMYFNIRRTREDLG